MADPIVNDPDHSDQDLSTSFTVSFTRSKWHQFWRFLILGTVMADYTRFFAKNAQKNCECAASVALSSAQKWEALSCELLPIFESVKIDAGGGR